MKYYILVFVLFFLSNELYPQFSGNSVFFTSPEVGYVAGIDWGNPANAIAKTTTGGISWTFQNGIENSLCYDIFFIDTLIGYAVGEDIENGGGLLLKTTNGGDDWVRQINGSSSSFRAVFFTDTFTGYVVGYDFFQKYRIIKTTDGGINWVDQYCESDYRINSVYFTDSDVGYIVSNEGKIFKTTDGGDNWIIQTSGTTYNLNSVYFIDSSKGYSIGDNGIILRTINGGADWITYNSGISDNLHSVFFTTNNKGFIVGDNGTILSTTNAGNDWIVEPSGTTSNLNSIHFPNELYGYITCDNYSILKTTNGGYTWVSRDITTLELLEPDGGEEWFSLESNVFLWEAYRVDDISIELSIDGGLHWTTLADSIPASQPFHWIPNNTDSLNECLVKITDITDSACYDISDNYFSLIPSSIYVDSPNGGEIWSIGSTEGIRWSSAGNFARVTIKLSVNNGADWSFIAIFIPDSGSYSWIVESPITSSECLVKVIQAGGSGLFDISDDVFTIDYPNSADEISGSDAPQEFVLSQNYPNPFNPSTKIKYALIEPSFVTLKLYNSLGSEVTKLINDEKPAGSYEIEFDASQLSSGIYFYRIQAGSFVETKKMILMK